MPLTAQWPGAADTWPAAPPNRPVPRRTGVPATLLVPDLIRAPIAPVCARRPRLKVLGHSEIPETHTIASAPSLEESMMNMRNSPPPAPARRWPRSSRPSGPMPSCCPTSRCPAAWRSWAMAPVCGADRRPHGSPPATPTPAARCKLRGFQRPRTRPASASRRQTGPRRRATHHEHPVLPGLCARAHAAPPVMPSCAARWIHADAAPALAAAKPVARSEDYASAKPAAAAAGQRTAPRKRSL